MKKAYSMQATNGVGTIKIYDDIGASWWSDGITASGFAKDLAAMGDVQTLNVHVNSLGGDVVEGAAIYTQIANHPAFTNVYIDGYAMSMASAIAMAGDRIYMVEHGLFMVHKPRSGVWGNATEMRAEADILDQFERTLMKVYVRRTGLSEDEITALLAGEEGVDGTYLDAEQARDLGFIDEIVEAKGLPAAACATLDPAAAARFPGMAERADRFLSAAPAKPKLLQRLMGARDPAADDDVTTVLLAHNALKARFDALQADSVQLESRLADAERARDEAVQQIDTARADAAQQVETARTEAVAAERQRVLTVMGHATELSIDVTSYIESGADSADAFAAMLAVKEQVDNATAVTPMISGDEDIVVQKTLNPSAIYRARREAREGK